MVDPQLFERQSSQHRLADPRLTLLPMLEGLSRALGYRRSLVVLYDPNRASLRGAVGLNVPEAIAEALEVPLDDEAHPLVSALVGEKPLRVDAVQEDGRLDEHTVALLIEMGIESFVAAPLPGASELSNGFDEDDIAPPAAHWRGQDIRAV